CRSDNSRERCEMTGCALVVAGLLSMSLNALGPRPPVLLVPAALDTSTVTADSLLRDSTVASGPRIRRAAVDTTTRPKRGPVLELTEWYDRRLTIHRVSSYALMPLFAVQYVLGKKLLDAKTAAKEGRGPGMDETMRKVHKVTGYTVD